jgi:hypothetical protein
MHLSQCMDVFISVFIFACMLGHIWPLAKYLACPRQSHLHGSASASMFSQASWKMAHMLPVRTACIESMRDGQGHAPRQQTGLPKAYRQGLPAIASCACIHFAETNTIDQSWHSPVRQQKGSRAQQQERTRASALPAGANKHYSARYPS